MDDIKEINKEQLSRMLRDIVWDYEISDRVLLQIFLSKKKKYSITHTELKARLLEYFSWHQIISVLGIDIATGMLEDDVLKRIFPKSYRNRLYGIKKILSGGSLPSSG